MPEQSVNLDLRGMGFFDKLSERFHVPGKCEPPVGIEIDIQVDTVDSEAQHAMKKLPLPTDIRHKFQKIL